MYEVGLHNIVEKLTALKFVFFEHDGDDLIYLGKEGVNGIYWILEEIIDQLKEIDEDRTEKEKRTEV